MSTHASPATVLFPYSPPLGYVIRWNDRLAPRLPEVLRDGGGLLFAVDNGARLLGTMDNHPEDASTGMLARELVGAVGAMAEALRGPAPDAVEQVAARTLVLPRSDRWREAVETALFGSWSDPLWDTRRLSTTALGALKAEARAVHRQLVPVWQRRTRHGRVLSLDADLGGLSLHDLVAADIDLLARAAGGVFEDERLNTVLRGLAPGRTAGGVRVRRRRGQHLDRGRRIRRRSRAGGLRRSRAAQGQATRRRTAPPRRAVAPCSSGALTRPHLAAVRPRFHIAPMCHLSCAGELSG